MVRIAITGGIACGKSLVAAYAAESGVPVCEADKLGHDVLEPGEGVYEAVVDRFGKGIVASDGRIDRTRLGSLVFGDAAALQDLNRLTHPEIIRRLQAWVTTQAEGQACVAAVIPLLYEIGEDRNWDRVVCVAAPEAEQMRRLAGRGLSAEEARLRIAGQWPQGTKMERADYVIYNSGSQDCLRRQTNDVVTHIRGA